MTTPPTGTVTFLFADIERSTRRWQDDPEAMRVALAEHDSIWRSVIEEHHGHLFKHTGDGVAAAFASASDACASAVDAQARLRDVLPVRIGLHTGEAEHRDGDYFGPTLNRCARLTGVAHGGQVVCSAATVELVRDRGDLRDLGDHRLRDLSRAERVWQVGDGEFPALQSLNTARTNLPLVGNAFVGRQLELDAISKDLADSRLVTLTGVGGVGKTRLALHAAGELLPVFADGVWLCELASAADADDMVHVVALALGVVQRQQMSLSESIVDSLRSRHLLMVLDNCEHLLDAAAELLDDVLSGAPRVRILATSREGFGIRDERIRPVRSLAVSDEHPELSDAVILFAERARAVDPSFVVDGSLAPAVVELCRRLDGIPLAIELAAARVAVMRPGEIVSHLDERFRLLTGGRRGRVERHQTLRAAIEWSYSLLDDTERTVFERLAVFPSSFDEAAAVAVCTSGAIGRWEVIDALTGLVAKSMLDVESDGDVTRYHLLETMRHFARDQAGDLDEMRRRFAIHYAAFAEQCGEGLMSRDELLWRHRLAAELDNLRAAVGWAFDRDSREDLVIGARIIDALIEHAMDEPALGIQSWGSTALARVNDLEPRHRAALYTAACTDAFFVGDLQRSRDLGWEAIGQSDSFTLTCYAAMGFVGSVEVFLGNPTAAMAVLAEGRRLVSSANAPLPWQTCVLHGLASYFAAFVGDDTTSRAEARHFLQGARVLGAPTLLSQALAVEGHASCIDNPQHALAALEEAVELFEAGAANSMYAPVLMDLAVVRAEAGNVTGAANALRRAVEHNVLSGDRTHTADAVAVATVVLADADNLEAAAVLDGARHGNILGQIAPTFSGVHRHRIDAARTRVATTLGAERTAIARQHGAAMTYDDIVAHTLQHLAALPHSPPTAAQSRQARGV